MTWTPSQGTRSLMGVATGAMGLEPGKIEMVAMKEANIMVEMITIGMIMVEATIKMITMTGIAIEITVRATSPALVIRIATGTHAAMKTVTMDVTTAHVVMEAVVEAPVVTTAVGAVGAEAEAAAMVMTGVEAIAENMDASTSTAMGVDTDTDMAMGVDTDTDEGDTARKVKTGEIQRP